MKHYLAVATVFVAFLLVNATYLQDLTLVVAQSNQTSPTSTPRPNAGAIIGGPQASASPIPSPALQFQGCHGSGKALPYLAGSLFHAVPHVAYDHSFHAQAIHNGLKGPTCLDCHTRNGDMATMLPASDSRSTINRANIAETCGKCHGDKSAMRGSGIWSIDGRRPAA